VSLVIQSDDAGVAIEDGGAHGAAGRCAVRYYGVECALVLVQNTLDKDSLLSCGLLSGATIDAIQEENTAVDSCVDIYNVVAYNVGPAVNHQHSLVILAQIMQRRE
jgi:hypothetical protein